MKALRYILPLVLLLLGVFGAVSLAKMRPQASRQARAIGVPVVEVQRIQRTEHQAMVQASGVVEAARQAVISPQVSGSVVWQAVQAVPGGRLKAGQLIARIDPRDYELAIEQAQGQVQQAEVNLMLEQSQQEVAKRQWARFDKKPGESASSLSLREPQVRSAEMGVASAKSALKRAQLNLERTFVRAPFNALVIEEQVEIGQIAAPGARLLTLVGTDEFWTAISVPLENLRQIEFPAEGMEGSKATVRMRLSDGRDVVRSGRVLRIKGGLDPASRTAQVVVAVHAPLTISDEPGEDLPLLPGAFVDVQVAGRALSDVASVPRTAVHDGNRVWLVDENDALLSRTVTVMWRDADQLYIGQELLEGDRVVTSPLALPVEGLKVKVLGTDTVAVASPP